MQHLMSSELSDFAAIYEADIELISVARTHDDDPLLEASNTLVAQNNFKAQWSQRIDDTNKAYGLLAGKLTQNTACAFAREINLASDMLGCLLDCPSVGIRIATLHTPMCPRFHVDRVPCRLLFTLIGAGTQWIAHDDVDKALFTDRETTLEPIKAGRSISQLSTRSWVLLKGGAWDDGFAGVVHRSPRGAEARLLVSVDPLFDAA
jgi:hypothetical protein